MSEVEFRKTYRGTWFAVLMVIVAFGFGLWLQGCRTQADLKSEPTATKYGERTKYDGHQNCSINRMLERIDVLEDRVELPDQRVSAARGCVARGAAAEAGAIGRCAFHS